MSKPKKFAKMCHISKNLKELYNEPKQCTRFEKGSTKVSRPNTKSNIQRWQKRVAPENSRNIHRICSTREQIQ